MPSYSRLDVVLVRSGSLLDGEFVLSGWAASGLNVATAVKRGVYTVHASLVIKVIGQLVKVDADELEQSLRGWLGLSSIQ